MKQILNYSAPSAVKLIRRCAVAVSLLGNGGHLRLRSICRTQRSTLNAIVAQNGKAIWTVTVRPEKLSKLGVKLLQEFGITREKVLQQLRSATEN